ncbi:MAG: putative major capsid protein [Prokaryotic dsDNA virus sp.]|nr:MAG: putative major capsid protein [Prokaryotic dsDNA virus sp.]
MTGYINTIRDLEAETYGFGGAFGGNDILKQAGVVQGVQTAHDIADAGASGVTGISTTTGLYNVLYGQKVWSMLNREVNALSMIAKRPYTSSGWRVLKSRPFGGSGNTLAESLQRDGTGGGIGADDAQFDEIGGVAENAGLSTAADGLGSMAPTYAQLFMSPKTVAHQFDFSELAMEMAKIDDGIGDIRAQMREDMGIAHAEAQNMMLLTPLENYGEVSALSNIERNYLSLNKIVTSRAELLAIDGGVIATDTTSASNNLGKIYGDERFSAASFLDAEVDFGSGYASGDVRSLTLTLLNNMIRNLRIAGGSPKVILTGYDTIQAVADLLQSQERFMDRKEIVPTVNGVRGVKGAEVGFRVATYYDIPLIPCKDMASTGGASSKLSDLLFLDTDHIWLAVMKPTQYFEDGISNGNPFGVGRLGNQALYRTIGEMGCSFFKGQGKITNIQ